MKDYYYYRGSTTPEAPVKLGVRGSALVRVEGSVD